MTVIAMHMPWHQAQQYWLCVLPREGSLPPNAVQRLTALGMQEIRQGAAMAYVMAAPQKEADRILAEAKTARVPAVSIGRTGGGKLTIVGGQSVGVNALVNAHESWFPSYMEGELPPSS